MNTRRWIVRVDALLVMVAGVVGLVISSLGYYRDTGPYAFLHGSEVGHAGLIQAYLLAVALAVVMLVGSRAGDPRPFNLVGAMVHASILPAYLLHWTFLGQAAGNIRLVVIFHSAFTLAELWAAAPHRRWDAVPAAVASARPVATR